MARQLGSIHYDQRNLDSLRDEAPAAYRDIREVMRAQHDLTRQERRLTPLLNFKYPDNRASVLRDTGWSRRCRRAPDPWSGHFSG